MPEVALIEVPSGVVLEVEGSPILNDKIFTGVYLIPVEIFTENNTTLRLEGTTFNTPQGGGLQTNDDDQVFAFLTDQNRIWVLDRKGNPFKVRGLNPETVKKNFTPIFPTNNHLLNN